MECLGNTEKSRAREERLVALNFNQSARREILLIFLRFLLLRTTNQLTVELVRFHRAR